MTLATKRHVDACEGINIRVYVVTVAPDGRTYNRTSIEDTPTIATFYDVFSLIIINNYIDRYSNEYISFYSPTINYIFNLIIDFL